MQQVKSMRLCDAEKLLEQQGWLFHHTTGSHRTYRDAWGTSITFAADNRPGELLERKVVGHIPRYMRRALAQRQMAQEREQSTMELRQSSEQGKVCKGCHEWKSYAHYGHHARAADGYNGYCSVCWRGYMQNARAVAESKRGNWTKQTTPKPEPSATSRATLDLSRFQVAPLPTHAPAVQIVPTPEPIATSRATLDLSRFQVAPLPTHAPAVQIVPTPEPEPEPLPAVQGMSVADWISLEQRPSALLLNDMVLVWCGDTIQLLTEDGTSGGSSIAPGALRLLAGKRHGRLWY